MSRRRFFYLIQILLPAAILIAASEYMIRMNEDRVRTIVAKAGGGVRAADLIGIWQHHGRLCFIYVRQSKVIIENELGATEPAEIRGRRIDVPGWRLSAEVSTDSKRIVWSDGEVWSR